jgi:hypothetical protein
LEFRLSDAGGIIDSFQLVILGDLFGDGEINTLSATVLNWHFAGDLVLEGAFLLAADMFGDGEVNTLDATVLNWHFAGDIDLFDGAWRIA